MEVAMVTKHASTMTTKNEERLVVLVPFCFLKMMNIIKFSYDNYIDIVVQDIIFKKKSRLSSDDAPPGFSKACRLELALTQP